MLQHNLIHHEEKAATCTEIGWEAYDACSDENCDYTTYKEIPALGHDLIHHDCKAATCEEKGWNAYDTCSRCNYTTYVELPALDHDIEHHGAKAPTCTEIGWEAYDTCKREGCNYTTYKEIPSMDHDLIHHDAQAATCTEAGWNAYDTCSRCNYTTYEEIPALGHDIEHHEAKAPTCTGIGWDAYDSCKRDGCDYREGYNEIPALDHDLEHHDAKAPTYDEVGWDEYDTCKREGCGYTTYVEIPKLVKVSEIKLTAKSTSIVFGESAQIQVAAEALPEDAYNKAVTWASSDTTIATVSKNGLVTFLKEGQVTITASAADGFGAAGTIILTAKPKDILVTKISLSVAKTTIPYVKGSSTITIAATVAPKNATNKTLKWISSSTAIATVDSNGKVTFKKAGTVTITCAAQDGSGIKATIKLVATTNQLVTSIKLKADKTTVSLSNGRATVKLTATVSPSNAKNKNLVWSSSDTNIATVKNGVVTFTKVGTVTITATAADGGGAKKAIKLTAVQPVTSIKLKADKTKVTLSNGKATVNVTATIKPTDATDKTVTWATSDKKIATVKNGKVYFKKAGTVTITCTANDGGKVKATIKLTASEPLITAFNLYVKGSEDPLKLVTDKSKAQTAITLKKGKTANLIADNFEPDDVSDKTLVWKSLSTKTVTVTDGKLKGVAKGTAIIQVSPKNNPKLVYYFKVKVK